MKTLISSVVLAIMVAFTALIGTSAANANVAMRITAPIEITKNSDVIKVHRRNYRHKHRRHYRRPRIYITPPRVHYRRGGHYHWHRHGYKRHRHKHWGGHHH
ncbi:MAG: hypothetical protein JKX91_14750 [Rhizobiaceae bacterium]|nr:hypothetical protein [Rhizobiaceae bacterium]